MSDIRRESNKISSISPSSSTSRSHQRYEEQDRNESKRTIRNMYNNDLH